MNNDEQLKRELTFDNYGRHAVIRDIIEANRSSSDRLKILDVGGRGNITKRFLPNDNVFYLDPNIKTDDVNFIKGNGCNIPLDDESFDWVVSADVFEHIEQEKRILFIKENLRVARKGVILAAPFFSDEVEQAELNINELHKKIFNGKGHQWLKEHIENGLPREDELKDFLNNNGYAFQRIGNNWLLIWEFLLGVRLFFNNEDPIIKELNEESNFFYNEEIFPIDNAEPSYRKIYFIKKEKSLIDLDIKNREINHKLLLGVINKRLLDMEKISSLSDSLRIKQLEERVNFITSSKFWKLRNNFMKIKSFFRSIVHRNHEKFISSCIKSAINQTVKVKEMSVIDDASDDNTNKVAEKLVKNAKMQKINVGSGPNGREGWINIDIQPFKGVDVVMDVTREWHFNEVDRIYAEHFIEHLNLDDGIKFLVNAGKSLRNGGWIRLSTPNVEWVLKTHYKFGSEGQDEEGLLNSATSINRAFHGWSHKFIYSPFILKKILVEIGYKNVHFEKFKESKISEFIDIEQHGQSSSFDDSDNVILIEAQRDGDIIFPADLYQILEDKFIKYAKSKG